MAGRCGSNRPHPRFTSEAVLAEEEHILTWAMDAPSRSRLHRRGPSSAPASMCCRPRRPPRWPATTGWCWWSARPVPARRRCSPPPSTTYTPSIVACSASPQRRRQPGYSSGTPACAPTPSPNCSSSGNCPTGRHSPTTGCAPGRPSSSTRPGWSPPRRCINSSPSPRRTIGVSSWSVTIASCKPSVVAACSPNCVVNGRVDHLEHLHRFKHDWEAAASLQLRSGDPRALDAYEAHDRIIPGTLDDHLASMADSWIELQQRGETVALVASTNDHVDAINRAVQAARVAARQLNPDIAVQIAGGECASRR